MALYLLYYAINLFHEDIESLSPGGYSGSQTKRGAVLMMFEKKKRYTIPKTLDQAADLLISDLPPDYRELFSKMDDADFDLLYETVGGFILDDFKLWLGNEDLLRSCYRGGGKNNDDPAKIILNRVREKLQEETGIVIIV